LDPYWFTSLTYPTITSTTSTSSTTITFRTCRKPYIRAGEYCCFDGDNDGLCDVGSTTSTTSTTLTGFERIFERVASDNEKVLVEPSVTVNEFYVSTSTTIEGITGPYDNKYRIGESRDKTNWGGRFGNGSAPIVICPLNEGDCSKYVDD
jgi:hypothetical protein